MKILNIIRKILRQLISKKTHRLENNIVDFYDQKASDEVRKMLESEEPCMIARFGSTELDCIDFYKNVNSNTFKTYINYVLGNIDSLSWSIKHKNKIRMQAGVFPSSNEILDRFSKEMIEDMNSVDILGSWLTKENRFRNELGSIIRIRLGDLTPFIHEIPWSYALKNRKVLVVHPFVDSIESQYLKRKFLFKNKKVLPEFKLITYKPVVSFADNENNVDFKNWFEALEFMKIEISRIDFDIAIIGCGAYGFPLASFVKKLGKKSVHLGGVTQLLFGIIGKRWEEEYNFNCLVNEHWIRPALIERPENFKIVENGCYW